VASLGDYHDIQETHSVQLAGLGGFGYGSYRRGGTAHPNAPTTSKAGAYGHPDTITLRRAAAYGLLPRRYPPDGHVRARRNTTLSHSATSNGFGYTDIAKAFNGPDGMTAAGDLLAEDYTHPSTSSPTSAWPPWPDHRQDNTREGW
jgi:hypothetical protein